MSREELALIESLQHDAIVAMTFGNLNSVQIDGLSGEMKFANGVYSPREIESSQNGFAVETSNGMPIYYSVENPTIFFEYLVPNEENGLPFAFWVISHISLKGTGGGNLILICPDPMLIDSCLKFYSTFPSGVNGKFQNKGVLDPNVKLSTLTKEEVLLRSAPRAAAIAQTKQKIESKKLDPILVSGAQSSKPGVAVDCNGVFLPTEEISTTTGLPVYSKMDSPGIILECVENAGFYIWIITKEKVKGTGLGSSSFGSSVPLLPDLIKDVSSTPPMILDIDPHQEFVDCPSFKFSIATFNDIHLIKKRIENTYEIISLKIVPPILVTGDPTGQFNSYYVPNYYPPTPTNPLGFPRYERVDGVDICIDFANREGTMAWEITSSLLMGEHNYYAQLVSGPYLLLDVMKNTPGCVWGVNMDDDSKVEPLVEDGLPLLQIQEVVIEEVDRFRALIEARKSLSRSFIMDGKIKPVRITGQMVGMTEDTETQEKEVIGLYIPILSTFPNLSSSSSSSSSTSSSPSPIVPFAPVYYKFSNPNLFLEFIEEPTSPRWQVVPKPLRGSPSSYTANFVAPWILPELCDKDIQCVWSSPIMDKQFNSLQPNLRVVSVEEEEVEKNKRVLREAIQFTRRYIDENQLKAVKISGTKGYSQFLVNGIYEPSGKFQNSVPVYEKIGDPTLQLKFIGNLHEHFPDPTQIDEEAIALSSEELRPELNVPENGWFVTNKEFDNYYAYIGCVYPVLPEFVSSVSNIVWLALKEDLTFNGQLKMKMSRADESEVDQFRRSAMDVQRRKELSKSIIESGKISPIRFTGATQAIAQFCINGIFVPTGEFSNGLPVYEKESDSNLILMFVIDKHSFWLLTDLRMKGASEGYATLRIEHKLLPELCIVEGASQSQSQSLGQSQGQGKGQSQGQSQTSADPTPSPTSFTWFVAVRNVMVPCPALRCLAVPEEELIEIRTRKESALALTKTLVSSGGVKPIRFSGLDFNFNGVFHPKLLSPRPSDAPSPYELACGLPVFYFEGNPSILMEFYVEENENIWIITHESIRGTGTALVMCGTPPLFPVLPQMCASIFSRPWLVFSDSEKGFIPQYSIVVETVED